MAKQDTQELTPQQAFELVLGELAKTRKGIDKFVEEYAATITRIDEELAAIRSVTGSPDEIWAKARKGVGGLKNDFNCGLMGHILVWTLGNEKTIDEMWTKIEAMEAKIK